MKLLSFLDPTGIMAVINGCIAFFNAVQSAIEYLRDMLESSTATCRRSRRSPPATSPPARRCSSRASPAIIPIAIGFLANAARHRQRPGADRRVFSASARSIDQALDWLIEQAIKLGAAILNALPGGDAATPAAAAGEGAAAGAGPLGLALPSQVCPPRRSDEPFG